MKKITAALLILSLTSVKAYGAGKELESSEVQRLLRALGEHHPPRPGMERTVMVMDGRDAGAPSASALRVSAAGAAGGDGGTGVAPPVAAAALKDYLSSPGSILTPEQRKVLEGSIDPETASRLKFSPLTHAIFEDNEVEVDRLLGGEVNLDEKDEEGETALISAIRSIGDNLPNGQSIFRKLLAKGSNPNVLGTGDRTPLVYAMNISDESLRFATAQHLLERGGRASINQMTTEGRTALIQAILHRDVRLTRLLLEYGADPSIGRASGLGALGHSVDKRLGDIANTLVAALFRMYPDRPLPVAPDDRFERVGDKNITTLLHVLAQGGMNYIDNINQILISSSGLKALGIRNGEAKLPEDIISDGALKGRMKALREDYKAFQEHLKFDISRNLGILTRLCPMAKYIGANASGFSEQEIKKAAKILEDCKKMEKVGPILAAVTALEHIVDNLERKIGELKASAAKDKKRIADLTRDIEKLCVELKTDYGNVKTLDPDVIFLRTKLDISLGTLRNKGNPIVKAAIDTLIPADTVVDKAAEKVALNKAAAYSPSEPNFDSEMTDIDIETLKALLKSSKEDQKAIQTHLDEKIATAKATAAAKGEEFTISVKALKRFIEKIRHMLAYKPNEFYEDVANTLETSLKRSVANQFIWDVLRFAQDEVLKQAYKSINEYELANQATVIGGGSVTGSLITPGSKLRASDMDDGGSTMGGSVLGTAARDHDFDGFDGVAGIGAGGSVDFEAGGGVEEDVFKGIAMPPIDIKMLHRDHLGILLDLFDHQYTKLQEDGSDLRRLFTALGDRFGVRNTVGGKAKINGLQITDNVAAASLAAAGKDPKYATISADAKHASYDFKGPKPRLAAGTLKLLTNAGITREMVEARLLLAPAGGAGAAAPAPAPASSSADVYVSSAALKTPA